MTEPPPPPDTHGLKPMNSCCAQTRKEATAQIVEQATGQILEIRNAFAKTKNDLRNELAEANSKLEKLETERAESADADDAIATRLAEKDAELDRLRRELDRLRRESEEKNKIIASQTLRLEAALRRNRESEARAKKQSETTAVTKPQARKGRAPVPLALQKHATLAMARRCYFAQAFALAPLPSSGPLNELGDWDTEYGALQMCLANTGKETCARLCRAGLAATRDIVAYARLLLAGSDNLEGGAGIYNLLEWAKRGLAPWGEISKKSGSEFVLMQTGLSLVTALSLVDYPMDKPLKITDVKKFYQFLLCIRKGDMHTPPRDGRLKFALYHIVRPKIPEFPWVFDSDIAQWKMPLHDYLAEFMAEVGSES